MKKPFLRKYFDFNVMYDLVVLEPYIRSFHDLGRYLNEREGTILMIEEGRGSQRFAFKGNFLTYHDPAAIERVGRALYVFINDPKKWHGFLSLLEQWRREYAPRMTLEAAKVYVSELSDDHDFLAAYINFFKQYSESCAVYLLTDGRYHEYSIGHILKKMALENADAMTAAGIFRSDKESVFQAADVELNEIRKLYQKKNRKWEQRFYAFLDRFVWLYVADTHYDLKEIVNNLKKQLAIKPSMPERKDSSKTNKIKISASVAPMVEKLRELGFQRMELRQYWQWQDYMIHKILESFEKKHRLPPYFLAFLTHDEVCDLMKNFNKKKLAQLFLTRNKRMKQVGILLENNNVRLYGQSASIAGLKKKLCVDDDASKIVTGQVAFRSEKKIVGNARVIKWTKSIQKELAGFKKGEIMVITQTKPDFLPYLRKAQAIVADEGGITSHVAIVSRELKIPTIMGTRIGTSVIKNGDKLEVDLQKGTVKILGRK